MGKNNLAVNLMLERKDIFADLVNGFLFQGKQVLHQDDLEVQSVHYGVMQEKNHHRIAAQERYGDIRMEADMGTYSVIIAEETQNSVDYAMVIRNMLYDALEYTKQIKELERIHGDKENPVSGKEILSGLRKEDKLKPVITLVLYCGDNWDASVCLYDLLEIDEDNETAQYIKNYIPDYNIHLIRPEMIPDMKVFRSSLQYIFSMVKYKSDKKLLKQYIREHEAEIESMNYVESLAALMLLGESKQVESILFKNGEEGRISMCKAIDDMIEDGRIEGRIEGENRLSSLINVLFKENCLHLLEQIVNDKVFREQMYQKYQL